MKFWCTESCIDSGTLAKVDNRGIPIRHNYRRENATPYDIDETQLRRLTAIGLFPESFSYGDDTAKAWVEAHNDEMCDIIDARNFQPTKPGPVEVNKPMLVRKGRTLDQRVLRQPEDVEAREKPVLQREAPAKKAIGRKPMSAEARAAAGERLRAARAAKKEKATATAGA